MKKFIGITGLALALFTDISAATSPRYENFGTLTNTPQIDAFSFANYGEFFVGSGAFPFKTQNTLEFTNRGSMYGVPGFVFETVLANGARQPAKSFFNANGASVFSDSFFTPAVLKVRADTIYNRGLLSVAPGGLLRLEGQNVDIQRSGLSVDPLFGSASQTTASNFFPELGVFDLYWGIGSMPDPVNENPAFSTDRLLSTVGRTWLVDSGVHAVTNAQQRRLATRLQLNAPSTYLYTNAVAIGDFTITNTVPGTTNTTTTNIQIATNIIVQAIFVATRDTNLTTSVTLYDSTIQTNEFKTVVVQLASVETNVVTGGNDFTTIYLADRLASETNYNTLTNVSTVTTFRPANYEVARVDPVAFGPLPLGTAVTNGVLTRDLLWNRSYTNAIVTNLYSAYRFFFTNQLQTIPSVANASITNLPGRVEIYADNLNMERARIRGEGVVNINAKHLESSKLAAIDVQNASFNLASTNRLLSVQNLTRSEVQRTAGTVTAFSAIWTNQSGFTLTNTLPDPADTNGQATITEISTNTVDITFHVFLVDARSVTTRQPNYVANLHAKGEVVSIADIVRVNESLLIEATHLNTSGKLLFTPGSALHDWADPLFPGLQTVTNSGLISVPGTGFYGSDRSSPYASFVNTGTNVAVGFRVNATYFENSGALVAGNYFEFGNLTFLQTGPGAITVASDVTKLDNGYSSSGGDISYTSRELKMRHYTNSTSASFVFNVSDNLSDAGGGSKNLIQTSGGMRLERRPARGDLLGTRIESSAARFALVSHTWAGEDRGVSVDGFKDNAAIGWWSVEGGSDSFQEFAGVGGKNGLYVDYLEFGPSYVDNLENFVKVHPDLTIYFADSNVDADQLDGSLGGKIKWVPQFAGPNSSVDVVLGNGRSVKMNRQFIQSKKIDSDGDGIANGFDSSPFGGVRIEPIRIVTTQGVEAVISWEAAASTTYFVEYSDNLLKAKWQLIKEWRNEEVTTKPAVVKDLVPVGSPERYYRIRYNP